MASRRVKQMSGLEAGENWAWIMKVKEKKEDGEWRRIVVPQGLTFSALSVVLACCWHGAEQEPQAEAFSFVFNRGRQCFLEDYDRGFRPEGWYAPMDATANGIDSYINDVKRFVWHCGLGEEHREYQIQVEKKLFYAKGQPIIAGLEKIYGTRMYTQEQIDEIIDWTRRMHFSFSSQREWISRAQLQGRLDAGQALPLQQEPESGVLLGMKPLFEQGLLGRKRDDSEELETMTLAETLETACGRKELEILAQRLSVRAPEGASEEELSERCAEAAMEEERLRAALSLPGFSAEDFELVLEVAREEGRLYTPRSDEEGERLDALFASQTLSFLFSHFSLRLQDEYFIPFDAAERVLALDTPQYRRRREELCRVFSCARLVPVLYGAIPLHVFGELCRRDTGFSLKDEKIRQILKDLHRVYPLRCAVICRDQMVVSEALVREMPDLADNLCEHSQRAHFYTPSEEEITQIARRGDYPDLPASRQVAQFLDGITKISEDEREALLLRIRNKCFYFIPQALERECAKTEEKFHLTRKQSRELERLVLDLCNESHVCLLQGFTPAKKGLAVGKLSQEVPFWTKKGAGSANRSRKEPQKGREDLARQMAQVLTRERLEKIAEELGIREQIRSGMKKAQVAELCARAYLEPEQLRKTMLLLYSLPEAYELILKVARRRGAEYWPEDSREAEQMEKIGSLYFWYSISGSAGTRYVIPADAAEAILALDTPEFRRWRADRRRVALCASLVPGIYGVISLHAFGRICRRDPDFSGKDEEVRGILDELQSLDPFGADAICEGRLVIDRDMWENLPESVDCLAQRGKGMRFYQPSEEEIHEIFWKSCLRSPQHDALAGFLEAEVPALSGQERKDWLGDLREDISLSDWSEMRRRCEKLVRKQGLSERQDRELERLAVDLYNHSHIYMHQGFTPLQKDEPILSLRDKDGEAGIRF